MGIHNTSRHFDELPDMSRKKQTPKSLFHRHIDRQTDKITAFYTFIQIIVIGIFQKIQSVIARRDHHIFSPQCPLLPQFHADRIQNSLCAHRLHDTAGAQNRNTAHDAKPWIKCLLCQLFTFRHRDLHRQDSTIIQHLAHL